MKRCKTCKWWQRDEKDVTFWGEYCVCNCPKMEEPDTMPNTLTRNDLDILVVAGDGGCILPGPEFGCVHHEEMTEGKT